MPTERNNRQSSEISDKLEAKARMAAMRIVALTANRDDPRFCRLLTSWEPDFASVIAKALREVERETRRETLMEAKKNFIVSDPWTFQGWLERETAELERKAKGGNVSDCNCRSVGECTHRRISEETFRMARESNFLYDDKREAPPSTGPQCAGYPTCDGDLPGEPHEADCPAAKQEAATSEGEQEGEPRYWLADQIQHLCAENQKREAELSTLRARLAEVERERDNFKANYARKIEEVDKLCASHLEVSARVELLEKALRDVANERDTELDMMRCEYRHGTPENKAWHDGVREAWKRFDIVKANARAALEDKR